MSGPNSAAIFLNETNIAWPKDKTGRYKNIQDYEKKQWIDVEDGKI